MIDPDVNDEVTSKETMTVRTMTLEPCEDCGTRAIYPHVTTKLCGRCLANRAYTDAVLERVLRDPGYAAKLKIALGG